MFRRLISSWKGKDSMAVLDYDESGAANNRKLRLSVSAEGAGRSLPDSSMNILHENPCISTGWISRPLINTEGEPLSPSSSASLSDIR